MASNDVEMAVDALQIADGNIHEEQDIEEALKATIQALHAEDGKEYALRQQSYTSDLSKVDPLVSVLQYLLKIQGTDGSIRIAEAGRKFKLHPRCVQCKQHASPTSLCVCTSCAGRPYHKGCWNKVPAHQSFEGFPTCDTPTGYTEYVWIHHLLDSKVRQTDQTELHIKDIWPMWFGVPHQQDRP